MGRRSGMMPGTARSGMTSRTDFTDEEWARLTRAPILAGVAIPMADPGGPIEVVKESNATLHTIAEAAADARFGRFVQELAQDVTARAKRRENPLAGFKPDRSRGPEGILDELRAVNALLVEKAGPEEVD